MVTDPAETSGPFEAALLQRGLPFVSAVEAEGYELRLSLISDGVGLGLVMPQVLRSSVPRRPSLQCLICRSPESDT
jgi:hypothetical protein